MEADVFITVVLGCAVEVEEMFGIVVVLMVGAGVVVLGKIQWM